MADVGPSSVAPTRFNGTSSHGRYSPHDHAWPIREFSTMERVIPLEGGLNFRDLGGYETQGGRRVRWRRVFRSGSMSSLTAKDDSLVQGLGIRVICDLRTARERQREAIRWSGSEVVRLEWDYDPSHISLGNVASAA